MIEFKKLTIEDKSWASELIKQEKRIGCEYSFASNLIWQDVLDISYGEICGCYTSKSVRDGYIIHNFPIGKKENIINAVKELIKSSGEKTIFRGLDLEQTRFLDEMMPNIFSFSTNRDESDYIYLSQKLITLSGKKLQSKRNHINRFYDNENWNYEQLDGSNIEECIELNRLWSESKENFADTDLRRELGAANIALACLELLNLDGGLLRLDGNVIAYSIGEPIGDDAYVVHFEKANAEIQGAYPTINQEFVKHNCKDYKYVNREEDAGDEGLRKAKLSYRPEFLLDKYEARLK